MTITRSKSILALAGALALLAGPATAQQNRQMQDLGPPMQAQSQDNSCRELVRVLRNMTDVPVRLDQADQNYGDQRACRQALANLAQRAHDRAGVSANVTPRDFRSGDRGRQQVRRQVPSQYRQERGRIVSVQPVRVRGVDTPNYLVVFETRPGRRVVADVGQNVRSANLRRGAPIAVRGQIVRIGNDKALLLADAIRVGNRSYVVNRPYYQRSAQR